MIAAQADLLIVGGLAVDRLADGSTVAGGSVLHGARAAAAAGWSVATITAVGPEPEALAAAAELSALGPSLAFPAPSSIRFAIHEGRGRRSLTLEASGGAVALTSADVARTRPRSVLLAPIAAELGAAALRAAADVSTRVAALQGWLRRLATDDDVHALSLDALGDDLSAELAELDAVIASEEDLAAVAQSPTQQLSALRTHLGPRPLIVITAGPAGAWLDDPATGVQQLPAGPPIEAISTIGAGDAVASLLTAGLGQGLGAVAATRAALLGAADYLRARVGR